MQTFLPYPDYEESAACLDDRRLGKQRLECLQILSTLFGDSDGWENHPAVLMWEGYEGALIIYAQAICNEWISRGFNDTLKEQIEEYENKAKDGSWIDPPFVGDEQFHLSHQSNLVRKNPEFYGRKFPGVKQGMEYVWPVTAEQTTT